MYTTHHVCLCLELGCVSSIDQCVKNFEFDFSAIVETVLLTNKHCYYFVDHSWFLDHISVPRSMLGFSITDCSSIILDPRSFYSVKIQSCQGVNAHITRYTAPDDQKILLGQADNKAFQR